MITNVLRFRIDCDPPRTTHHSKKIIRLGKFSRLADTPELRAARESWIALLRPHAPAEPIPGPVYLSLAFTYPWRASDTKRDRALGEVPCTVKPDCSNAAKTVEDVMALLRFFENDNLVSDLRVSKSFGNHPGLVVALGTIDYHPAPGQTLLDVTA